MIKINLLAPESIKKEERQEFMLIAYAVLVLVILAGLFNFGMKYKKYFELTSKTKALEQELVKYEEIVRQVDALQASKAALENQKNVIDSLMATRLVYPYFFEELIKLLPENIWFQNLNTKLDQSVGMQVDINAQSLDNYAIADFITALSSDPSFSKIELGAITTTASEKVSVSNFKISFDYKKVVKQ